MIRCTKCGTINPDGNRFCSSCGAPLQRTQIRCPSCHRMNPAGNVFCDYCHTRLVPAESVIPRSQGQAEPPGDAEESARQISLPVRSDLGRTGQLGELPEWLSGLVDETPPPTTYPATDEETEAPVPAVELPDWLLGLQAGSEETAPAEEEAAGLPDWLGVLGAAAAEEAPLPAEEEAAGLPDWLSGLGASAAEEAPHPVEEEEAAGLPDWLGGLGAPAAEEAPLPVEEEAAGLPDWLSKVASAGEVVAGGGEELIIEGPAPSGAAGLWLPGAKEVEAAPETEEVPDWLKALAPQDLPSAPGQGAFLIPDKETFEGGAIPDLTPIPEPRKPTTDELARANVPEWLRALRPEDSFGEVGDGTAIGTVFTDAAALEESLQGLEGDLVRAEIPDWLQELKPSGPPRPEGMTLEQFISQATETEGGPLSGMKGLLQPEAVVDIPADYKPVPRYDLPAVVLERAQMWKSLLEQPRSTQRSVAPRRARAGVGETLGRVFVTAALLVVILWVLLGFPVPVSVPLPEAPGVTHVSKTLEALPAGARVLVAVEYGPAEEAEMAFMTEPLLDHLAAREVQVDWVSTLPEAVGLINNLKTNPAWQEPWKTPGYLPGTTTGIATYLSLNEYDLLIVLAARSDHLRWWLEQNTVGPRMPIVVGVSNAVGSLMIPYLEIENLRGVMVGVQDGSRYLMQRYGEPLEKHHPLARRQLNALVGAQWVTAGLLILGAGLVIMTRKKGAA